MLLPLPLPLPAANTPDHGTCVAACRLGDCRLPSRQRLQCQQSFEPIGWGLICRIVKGGKLKCGLIFPQPRQALVLSYSEPGEFGGELLLQKVRRQEARETLRYYDACPSKCLAPAGLWDQDNVAMALSVKQGVGESPVGSVGVPVPIPYTAFLSRGQDGKKRRVHGAEFKTTRGQVETTMSR